MREHRTDEKRRDAQTSRFSFCVYFLYLTDMAGHRDVRGRVTRRLVPRHWRRRHDRPRVGPRRHGPGAVASPFLYWRVYPPANPSLPCAF